jgi:hypothetical protein
MAAEAAESGGALGSVGWAVVIGIVVVIAVVAYSYIRGGESPPPQA